jgi:hypothetical protein
VVTPLPTPTTYRQQRPNPSPRHIGQLTTSHHQRMINERWSNDSQDTPQATPGEPAAEYARRGIEPAVAARQPVVVGAYRF